MATNRATLCLILCLIILIAGACKSTPEGPGPSANSNAPAAPPKASGPSVTPAPLPQTAYRVEWISNQIPSEMATDKEYHIAVTLRNAGNEPWPSKGTGGGQINQVSIAYHWLAHQAEKVVLFEGHRTALPHDVTPGETISVNNVVVTTPGPGTYRLQLTLVHEGVAWFEEQGSKTLIASVTVR